MNRDAFRCSALTVSLALGLPGLAFAQAAANLATATSSSTIRAVKPTLATQAAAATSAITLKEADLATLELRRKTVQQAIATLEAEQRSLQPTASGSWEKNRLAALAKMLATSRAELAQIEADIGALRQQLAALKKSTPTVNASAGHGAGAAVTEKHVVLAGATPADRERSLKTFAQGRPTQRVDLSQVVSPYLAETERNLSKLFADAERSGTVLVFDEADALFGKRTDVKDSHDRYANLDTNYLLQKLEQSPAAVVILTNEKSAAKIDPEKLIRWRQVPPDQEGKK